MSDQEEIYATLIEIKAEPTELYKILKFESLVSGGGEAKQVISEGYVTLNGEVETRKRKKVYAGDLIFFNDQYFQVALVGQTDDYEIIEQTDLDSKLSDNKISNDNTQTAQAPNPKKARKPISF